MDRNPAGYLHYLKVFRFPHEYRIKQNKIKKIAGLNFQGAKPSGTGGLELNKAGSCRDNRILA
jgi:hypothetical protein